MFVSFVIVSQLLANFVTCMKNILGMPVKSAELKRISDNKQTHLQFNISRYSIRRIVHCAVVDIFNGKVLSGTEHRTTCLV